MMTMQQPTTAGTVGAATGDEQARAVAHGHHGVPLSTYTLEVNASGYRHGSPSALGAELLSDDSLTMSPEQYVLHKRGTLKRDARARLHSGKRLAVSLPRPTRKDSPSTRAARERSARLCASKSLEERVLAAELQGAADRKAIKDLKDEIETQNKLGFDMRREVFGARATVADALAVIENKFSTMEGQLEGKIASIDGQMAVLRRSLEQAEAQLPMDGQVVQESFAKLASEIETIKQTKGEAFTKQMCAEPELMRQHVVDHQRQILELAGGDAHHQMLIDNLGLAYAQLLATIENSKAPPDTADMPEWNRPPRGSNGLPSEQSYGGCGGCSGNFGGKCGGLGLTGAWNFVFSGNSAGGFGGSGLKEATEDSLETPGEDLEALDQGATEEPVTEQQATTTQPAGP